MYKNRLKQISETWVKYAMWINMDSYMTSYNKAKFDENCAWFLYIIRWYIIPNNHWQMYENNLLQSKNNPSQPTSVMPVHSIVEPVIPSRLEIILHSIPERPSRHLDPWVRTTKQSRGPRSVGIANDRPSGLFLDHSRCMVLGVAQVLSLGRR